MPGILFFANHFKPIKGIRSLHHMVFDSAKPGVVSVKKSIIDEPEEVITIKTSKDALEAAGLPATLPPAGLSEMRQAYLYKQVRPHVPAALQDGI